MKKNTVPARGVLSLVILFFACQVMGQKQFFDIASFIPPKGWHRLDSNGVLLFANARTNNNQTSFCQIFLYPSRSSNSSPMENFNAEWGEKVVGPFQTHDDPMPQSEKPDKGWTPVTGHVNIKVGNDINYTCILVAASGHGRVMSIIITLAGQEFTADAKKFLEEMDLDVRAVANGRRDGGGACSRDRAMGRQWGMVR